MASTQKTIANSNKKIKKNREIAKVMESDLKGVNLGSRPIGKKETKGNAKRAESDARKDAAAMGIREVDESNHLTAEQRMRLEASLRPRGKKVNQVEAKPGTPFAEVKKTEWKPMSGIRKGDTLDELGVKSATSEFSRTRPGEKRERLRATVGRALRDNSLFSDHPGMAPGAPAGQIMHPCQTPGCSKLADYNYDSMVCPSCEAKGNR